MPGLSYNAKKNRRNRNLVSMKFNLVNWMFESLSTLLVFVNINRFSGLFYVLVMSCGTPIIYLIGIEENRLVYLNKKICQAKVQSRSSQDPKSKVQTGLERH